MNNEEKILEMLTTMQQDIVDIKTDVAGLKTDVAGLKVSVARLEETVDELKAAHEETRGAVNALLRWAEEVGNTINFPLPRIADV